MAWGAMEVRRVAAGEAIREISEEIGANKPFVALWVKDAAHDGAAPASFEVVPPTATKPSHICSVWRVFSPDYLGIETNPRAHRTLRDVLLRTSNLKCNTRGMKEILLPPSLAALVDDCETICEKECCGIGAFFFSPISIMYHLTRWGILIRAEDVERLRAELAEISEQFPTSVERSERFLFRELNAILSGSQVLSLLEEINSSLSDACVIHQDLKDKIEGRWKRHLQITK